MARRLIDDATSLCCPRACEGGSDLPHASPSSRAAVLPAQTQSSCASRLPSRQNELYGARRDHNLAQERDELGVPENQANSIG